MLDMLGTPDWIVRKVINNVINKMKHINSSVLTKQNN